LMSGGFQRCAGLKGNRVTWLPLTHQLPVTVQLLLGLQEIATVGKEAAASPDEYISNLHNVEIKTYRASVTVTTATPAHKEFRTPLRRVAGNQGKQRVNTPAEPVKPVMKARLLSASLFGRIQPIVIAHKID
jgi:hypothetical protein